MTFTELFKTILIADKDQSCKATRQVRKFLYSSQGGGKNEFKEIQKIIQDAPGEYAEISDGWRQENFVTRTSSVRGRHPILDNSTRYISPAKCIPVEFKVQIPPPRKLFGNP